MSTTIIPEQLVQGGVMRVIDSATGDIAVTTSSAWIEDEKYGFRTVVPATACSAEFDSTVTRTGRLTLKFSTTNTTGRGRVNLFNTLDPGTNSTVAVVSKYGIPVKASTTYKMSVYAKTNNVANDSAYLNIGEFKISDGTSVTSGASNKLSGSQDWTELTKTFTTNAATTHLGFSLAVNVAGNISDAWFDVNSMTLEEVSTITNSSSSPALLYPKFTAVSSTDNIDQSQVVLDANHGTVGFGQTATVKWGQQFLPTKKNFTGFTIRRGSDTGTFTGTVSFSIQANNSGAPSGTDLITPVTISNAAWGAISVNTDYTVTLPTATLNVDSSTTYWLVLTSSTSDNSNYTRIYGNSAGAYAGGIMRKFDGSVWTTQTGYDAYFKTLYSKNTTNVTARTDTETWSLSTSPDGWADGTEIDGYNINAVKPLTLAPGVNNIYYSANCADAADGTVDSSMQMRVSGRLKIGGSNKGVHRSYEPRKGKRATNYGVFNQH